MPFLELQRAAAWLSFLKEQRWAAGINLVYGLIVGGVGIARMVWSDAPPGNFDVLVPALADYAAALSLVASGVWMLAVPGRGGALLLLAGLCDGVLGTGAAFGWSVVQGVPLVPFAVLEALLAVVLASWLARHVRRDLPRMRALGPVPSEDALEEIRRRAAEVDAADPARDETVIQAFDARGRAWKGRLGRDAALLVHAGGRPVTLLARDQFRWAPGPARGEPEWRWVIVMGEAEEDNTPLRTDEAGLERLQAWKPPDPETGILWSA